jgi:hypothetical protein
VGRIFTSPPRVGISPNGGRGAEPRQRPLTPTPTMAFWRA